MISRTHQYAIQAVLYLAQAPGRGPLPAGQIALGLGLPGTYLSKILHPLARAGVLALARGRRGGYRLARPAGELSRLEVMTSFEMVGRPHHCPLGQEDCDGEDGCGMHERCTCVIEPLNQFFERKRVADLVGATWIRESGTEINREHSTGEV